VIDTGFLDALDCPSLEVRRHDVAVDELPEGEFDLVHSRMVGEHLPNRKQVLRRMAAALKPAGWLVVEATDFVTVVPDPAVEASAARLFARGQEAHIQYLAETRGFDRGCGRGLSSRLRALGLTGDDAEGRVFTWRGGSAGAGVWRHTAEQLRGPLVDGGTMTAEEIDRVVALLDDPAFAALSPAVIAAWGRRPPV